MMQKSITRSIAQPVTVGIGAAGGSDVYSVLGFNPKLVAAFVNEYYRKSGGGTTFGGLLTHSRSGNATMVDSDGLLKWAPHNLVLNSASPATQSITVVSGADYTVECTGSGSITLSNAGTGTVTAGNPVEITAASTTLTLTVSGGPSTMWAYRSDLGGMVNNPDTGTSYVATTGAAKYLARRGHHIYNGTSWVNEGILVESEARTNLFLNSGTLSTQDVATTAQPYTVSFTGTGTITFSGAHTGSLVGTGTGENNRVNVTFTPSAGTVTCTVTGTVTNAQFEAGQTPSSYIPTSGATATRAAETLTIAAANLPYSSAAMSIAMKGKMTYADENVPSTARPILWSLDGSNLINCTLSTSGSFTGGLRFQQAASAVYDVVDSSGTAYSPDINVPFNIASAHTSGRINGAVDGTALTENATPTALPDLSATALQLAFDYMGTISEFKMYDTDITDVGLELESAA